MSFSENTMFSSINLVMGLQTKRDKNPSLAKGYAPPILKGKDEKEGKDKNDGKSKKQPLLNLLSSSFNNPLMMDATTFHPNTTAPSDISGTTSDSNAPTSSNHTITHPVDQTDVSSEISSLISPAVQRSIDNLAKVKVVTNQKKNKITSIGQLVTLIKDRRNLTDREKQITAPTVYEQEPDDDSLIIEIVEVIEQSWTIWDIVQKRCPPSWWPAFNDARNELYQVSQQLANREKIDGHFFPSKTNIFRAFEQCSLEKVKVVIVGQDPYHNKDYAGNPVAQGMSFSVPRHVRPINPSLRNIYKVLANTIDDFEIPEHGDLSSWTYQGVLLLNSCLTVQQGKPGSHGSIWMPFIDKVLYHIGKVNPNCIYVLWGRSAQKLATRLSEKAIVLESSHPSPFSARHGFNDCDHFNKINELLKEQGKTQIDWQIY